MLEGDTRLIWDIALSDWISWLKTLPDNSIQVFFTSPPYWGLRDYGVEGQLGFGSQPANVKPRNRQFPAPWAIHFPAPAQPAWWQSV